MFVEGFSVLVLSRNVTLRVLTGQAQASTVVWHSGFGVSSPNPIIQELCSLELLFYLPVPHYVKQMDNGCTGCVFHMLFYAYSTMLGIE